MPVWMLILCLVLAAAMTFVESWVFKLDISLPHIWFRRRRLHRAWRDYSVYDPPHKVEECRLSKDLAMENFDYFMKVRLERLAYLQGWLRKRFRVSLTLDRKGVKKLNRWGNKYAGLLMDDRRNTVPVDCYLTYNPAWTGSNIGCNIVFDMGIAMGEAMIAQCPNLHWAFDKSEEFFPRTTARMLKEGGLSFQRPKIYGYNNPVCCKSPLHSVRSFALQMSFNTVSLKQTVGLLRMTSYYRRLTLDILINEFDATLRYYPAGGLNYNQDEISFEQFAAMIDQHTIEKNYGDD